jgi:SAM-dependent methyltransferase
VRGKSYLVPFRRRIDRMVGVDLHVPDPPMPHLDEFAIVDLCGPASAFPEGTFDIVLSNFTLEHFTDPPAALRNLRRWLSPGGTLVVSTVNPRHPFVAAYLGMPTRLQRRLQPIVKLRPPMRTRSSDAAASPPRSAGRSWRRGWRAASS